MFTDTILIQEKKDTIWFETIARAKSLNFSIGAATKDGIQYEIEFGSAEAREAFVLSVRNEVTILH